MTIVESAWRKLARNEWPMCFWTALAINHLFSSKRQNTNLNRNCCQSVLSPDRYGIKTARETLSDLIKCLLQGMSFYALWKTDGSCQKWTVSKWHASLHSFVYLFTWAFHILGLIHRMLKTPNPLVYTPLIAKDLNPVQRFLLIRNLLQVCSLPLSIMLKDRDL